MTLAVSHPVLRAEAEEAAGQEGAPGGNVVPCQAARQLKQRPTSEGGRHWPLATRVTG